MGKSIVRNCDWCKNPYKAWSSYIKRGDGLCCSKKCSSARKEHKKTPDKFCVDCNAKLGWSAKYSPERNIMRCVKCFALRPLSIRAIESQFKKGLIPWNKGIPHLAKEKHPNWKGGISEVTRTERMNFMQTREYKGWRLSIFERDGFKCQGCGQVGGELEADHIKSWTLHPELRLDLSNGQTLCRPCHRKKTNQEMKKMWSNQYTSASA